MTEMEVRRRFVAELKKYEGAGNGNGMHRLLIDTYNSNPDLPRGYPMKITDAWCAATPSAIAVALGWTDVVFPECGCGKMIDLYQQAGRWVEDDGYRAQIADLVMYDWDDDGQGDCTGAPSHVGTVIATGDNGMTVMEGNGPGNQMVKRFLPYDARYIRGFCCPDYASLASCVGGFADVSSDAWYAEAVQWAKAGGITEGVDATHFAPDKFCTRAEVVTMIWRALKK